MKSSFKKRIVLTPIIILAIFGFLSVCYAQQISELPSSEVEIFKNNFGNRMKTLNSLQGKFTQVKHFDFSEDALTSKGIFYFQSPTKIRWEYQTPTSHNVILNDGKVATGTVENLKPTKTGHNNGMQEIIHLVSNLGDVHALFDPKISDIKFFKRDGNFMVRMRPKDRKAKRFIQSIEITIKSKDYLVEQINIKQTNQDYMLLNFSAIEINPKIDPALFKMP